MKDSTSLRSWRKNLAQGERSETLGVTADWFVSSDICLTWTQGGATFHFVPLRFHPSGDAPLGTPGLPWAEFFRPLTRTR